MRVFTLCLALGPSLPLRGVGSRRGRTRSLVWLRHCQWKQLTQSVSAQSVCVSTDSGSSHQAHQIWCTSTKYKDAVSRKGREQWEGAMMKKYRGFQDMKPWLLSSRKKEQGFMKHWQGGSTRRRIASWWGVKYAWQWEGIKKWQVKASLLTSTPPN